MNCYLSGAFTRIGRAQMRVNGVSSAKYSTDSKTVSTPNICVVKDFKKDIEDAFDIVEQIKEVNSFKYKVTHFNDTKKMTVEKDVNCFDGAGIVSYERAKIWAKELGLNYVPSSFQIRVLNGIKGNLYTFPLTEYIEYLEGNGLSQCLEVKDLWNNLVNIKEKNIDVFLTESQFKFHDMYDDFERSHSIGGINHVFVSHRCYAGVLPPAHRRGSEESGCAGRAGHPDVLHERQARARKSQRRRSP